LAHYNLGIDLKRAGKPVGAIARHKEALRINFDYAEAHFSLGLDLAQPSSRRRRYSGMSRPCESNPILYDPRMPWHERGRERNVEPARGV